MGIRLFGPTASIFALMFYTKPEKKFFEVEENAGIPL